MLATRAATPTRPKPDAVAGILWMLAATFLFVVMALCARIAARYVTGPQVAAARSVLGALVVFLIATGRRATLRIHNKKWTWLRSLLGTIAMLLFFHAMTSPQIPLGDVATLRATTPIIMAALSSWVLGERTTKGTWAAIAMTVLGVVMVVNPTLHTPLPLAVAVLVGSVLSALAMLALRKASPTEEPEAIAFHFSAVSGVVMAALAACFWRTPEPQGWIFLAAVGTAGALAQICATRAYALDRAARVGTVTQLSVVLTQAVAFIWLDEQLSVLQVVGSILVVAAGVLLAILAARENRRDHTTTRTRQGLVPH